MSKLRFKLKDILAALKRCNGQVNLASQQLGCDRDTIYARAKEHPIIRETIDAIRDEMVDIAEVGLRKAVLDGDLDAIKFTLKTIGKHRGYYEKYNIEVDLRKLLESLETMPDAELLATLRARGLAPAVGGSGVADEGAPAGDSANGDGGAE